MNHTTAAEVATGILATTAVLASLPPIAGGVAPISEALHSPRELTESFAGALAQVRAITKDGLDTASPKFDAVLGCLEVLGKLKLTVADAQALLLVARQERVQDLSAHSLNYLEAQGLIERPGLIPRLTTAGENTATVIIACTALAEASNAKRRLDAARKAAA